jgi:Family of unknown function (DUF5675)
MSAITILRQIFTSNSTIGQLYLDGEQQCFTLEPAQDSGELVPPGTYQARMEWSPRFQTMTPHLKGVPGYQDAGPHGPVEIHWGNYPGNTEGCCLVGTNRSIDFVGNSRVALEELVAKLPPTFTVTYQNQEDAS